VKLASINLRKLVLSPTGSINLGFILRKDLLLCSSYLPLGVPNRAVIYTPSIRVVVVVAHAPPVGAEHDGEADTDRISLTISLVVADPSLCFPTPGRLR
jgi:hypothetical protein